jgi:hypothetical protein
MTHPEIIAGPRLKDSRSAVLWNVEMVFEAQARGGPDQRSVFHLLARATPKAATTRRFRLPVPRPRGGEHRGGNAGQTSRVDEFGGALRKPAEGLREILGPWEPCRTRRDP